MRRAQSQSSFQSSIKPKNKSSSQGTLKSLSPATCSDEADCTWEVLLDHGWKPYNAVNDRKLKDASRRGESDVLISVTQDSNSTNTKPEKYRVTFVDSDQAEQVNLWSYYVRPLRRSKSKSTSESPLSRWSQVLSHPSLEFDHSRAQVGSADEDITLFASEHTRLAYRSELLHSGSYRIPVTYRTGTHAYLLVGIVQVSCREMRDGEGKLLNTWPKEGGSYHAGCYFYSFYYNKYSANGSDWEDFENFNGHEKTQDSAVEVDFASGDQLLIDLSIPEGTLSFSFQKNGQEDVLRLGTIATDLFDGQFRVCAVLGLGSQCIGLGSSEHSNMLPPHIPQTVLPSKKSKAQEAVLQDTASRGINLKQLIDLGYFMKDALSKHLVFDKFGQRVTWETMTMYQVNELFVVPLTRASACSYVEFVAKGSQAPQWMVSHAWSTPFTSTLRMLMLHSRSRYSNNPLNTLYWCCTMANNQHDLSELNEEDIMQSPFARVLTNPDCTGTVLLCDSDVTPMKRVWCVFEMHISESLRSGRLLVASKAMHFLDVAATVPKGSDEEDVAAMLEDALDGNWHEITDAPGTYFPLQVAEVGTQVDIAEANSSMPRDRNAILNFVATQKASPASPPSTHENYDMLNSFIHSIFASAELYRLACERPEHCVESMARLLEMRADPNKFVRHGNTTLFAVVGADPKNPVPASEEHLRPMLELLLGARADPNCLNRECATVLDCATAASGEVKTFLRGFGAKPFVEVASVHERNLNTMINKIVSRGFTSESDAFGGSGGGGSGSKLLSGAGRALQQVAAVLKRYPQAVCRVEVMLTKLDKLKKRGSVIQSALQAAGCNNPFDIHMVDRGPLLSIALYFPEHVRSTGKEE